MSRKDARELAFKLVFEYSFTLEEKRDMVEEYVQGLSSDDSSYINEAYYGVISHYDELTEKISQSIIWRKCIVASGHIIMRLWGYRYL